MKAGILTLMVVLALPALAQINRTDRRSLLDSDPEVVYMERTLKQPITLTVVKKAPVFSDKEGKHRLGFLKADQKVTLEAMTDKVYRVRGQGTRDGIAGWVAPWAFSSKDPEFVENLKKLYERQIEVQALIEAEEVAMGMTVDEVQMAKGKPTKASLRRTSEGEVGRWEFVDYEDVKHYITRIDRTTGQAYRQFSHMTREEKGKVVVEFENGLVTAIEESEDREGGGNVRIIVPPVIWRW